MAETGAENPERGEDSSKERENLDRLLKIFNGGTGVNLGVRYHILVLLKIINFKKCPLEKREK